jgi:hypothetical protein
MYVYSTEPETGNWTIRTSQNMQPMKHTSLEN